VEAARKYAKSRNIGEIKSGCACVPRPDVPSKCYVPCSPEKMRATTERKLRELGLYPAGKSLTMPTYIMARNIQSEAGSGTGAEKLAMGEALIARARVSGKSFAEIAMWRGQYFGAQYGKNPAVATRKDPRWEDIVAAELVLAGETKDFTRGATHYFSPRGMDYGFSKGTLSKNARMTYDRWVDDFGLVWVGHVPGIDTRSQMLFREGQPTAAQRAAGVAALRSETPRDIYRAPTCVDRPFLASGGGVALAGLGALVLAVPAFFLLRRRA
jgi:hypothetical protein